MFGANCYRHADNRAIGRCQVCRNALCVICINYYRGQHLCQLHYGVAAQREVPAAFEGATAFNARCPIHPDAPALAACDLCAKPCCLLCINKFNDATYCDEHYAEVKARQPGPNQFFPGWQQAAWIVGGVFVAFLGLFVAAGGWRVAAFRYLVIAAVLIGVFAYRYQRARR